MKTARDIENAAAKWLVRRDRGELKPVEMTAFQSWLAAEPRHRATYLRMQAAWRRASQLGARMRPFGEDPDPDLLEPETRPRSARSRFVIGLMAAAAGVVIATSLGRDEWETAATEFGGLQEVAFADGTRVHLNTETELRLRVTPRSREVVVLRGEARFDVVPDPSRPFEVEADGAVVRAMGTTFAVRIRARHRVDVLVEEGLVAVAHAQSPRAELQMLSTGQRASVDARHIAIRRVGREAIERELAWTEGSIWLDGETLAVAVAEFNRYNHRRLVIADPAIATQPVAGRFDKSRVDEFVSTTEVSFGVRAERVAKDGSPGEIRLYKKKQ